MKNHLLLLVALLVGLVSCRYDDKSLWNAVDNMNKRVSALEELCNKMNENILSLQTVVNALQKKDLIESVIELPDKGGYTINFTSGKSINIYNGANGKNGEDGIDGETPIISVRQDTDGIYYWTINNDWLIVDGRKVKAIGENGLDGVTPQLKIENDYWYISYDNKVTWEKLDKAIGNDGKDSIENVKETDEYVEFTISDGQVIIIPKITLSIVDKIKSISYIPRYDNGKAPLVKTSNGDCYIELDFEVSPNNYADSIVKYSSIVSLHGVYTIIQSKAVNFVEFPIISMSANNSILSLKVSGENLDESVFWGTQGANITLKLEDNKSSYTSNYIGIEPSVQTYSFSATFKTKFANQTIKVANDNDAFPIAGIDNNLLKINYGDGSTGVSSVHTYAEEGEYIVTFSFTVPISKIGQNAFCDCVNMIDIEYSEGITNIEESAFRNTGLINIVIPDTVSSIGIGAFDFCSNVKSINLPNSIKKIQRSFYKTTGELYVNCDIPSSTNHLGDDGAFYSSCFSKIIIGKDVKSIGDCAFYGCNMVKSIEYEEGNQLECIGYGAFYTPLVEDMPIPNSLKMIGDYSFVLCSSLKRFYHVGSGSGNYSIRNDVLWYVADGVSIVRYPPMKEGASYTISVLGVKSIMKGAFRDCVNLEEINLSYSPIPTLIEDGAFNGCNNLKRVNGFEMTNPTLDMTFNGCENLTSVQLPETINEIGYGCFYGCKSLTGNLNIPEKVKIIGQMAFGKCSNLSGNIVIPDSVEKIENGAFIGCNKLLKENNNLKIGAGLKSIGKNVFDIDDNSTFATADFDSVYCSAGVPPILESVFGCNVLIVPKGCKEIYQNSNWNSVANNIIEQDS